MTSEYPAYSVLMSLYIKEKPEYLAQSLGSMLAQSVPPAEIVMVEDGPLTPELKSVLQDFDEKNPKLLKVVSYPENKGLGYALSVGLRACSNEFVARMDTDDIAMPDRMEKEFGAFHNDAALDMVGSQIVEFIENPEQPVSHSDLPESPEDIRGFSKRRNPFRHPTMVFRRSKALEAGGYSSDYLFFEDWDIWNRMLSHGCNARNIPDVTVAMRVSPDFYARRGGREYLAYAYRFKIAQVKRGYFSAVDFCLSFFPHAAVCLMPNSLRSFVYKTVLRK